MRVPVFFILLIHGIGPLVAKATNGLRSLVSLMRLRNAPTAAADVLAGGLFAMTYHGGGSYTELALLTGASICLYSGGMVTNDLSDREKDLELHPERPLPSGDISPASAFFLSVLLLLGGVFLALSTGPIPGLVGSVIVAGILLYNFTATQHPIAGPLLMGGLRGANLCLGLSVAGSPAFHPRLYVGPVFAVLLAAHIVAITVISQYEETPEEVNGLLTWAGIHFLIVFSIGFLLLLETPTFEGLSALVPLLIYIFLMGPAVSTAVRKPVSEHVSRIVILGIWGVILLDSAFVAATVDLYTGTALLLLLVPVLLYDYIW